MVTGKLPYEKLTQIQLITEVGKNGLRPSLDDEKDCSKEWKEIITQCWSQDPQSRPTMKQVVEMIEKM